MNARLIMPAVLGAISIYWLWMAFTHYGIWHEEGPKGGFMPMIAAGVTLVFCVADIIQGLKHSKKFRGTVFIPAAIILLLLALVPFVGLLPAMWCMLFVWVCLLERYPVVFSLIFSSGIVLVMWLIFKVWLSVPFPVGIFGF